MGKWKESRRHHSSRVMVNFFLKLLSLKGFIMGPTTMVFNLVRLAPPFLLSVLYCFLSHPEMKFLHNVPYLYTFFFNQYNDLSYKGEMKK